VETLFVPDAVLASSCAAWQKLRRLRFQLLTQEVH
jgi:hypothetical protein